MKKSLPLPYFVKTTDGNISLVIFYSQKEDRFIGIPRFTINQKKTKIKIDGMYYNFLPKGPWIRKEWFFNKEFKEPLKRYLKHSKAFDEKLYIWKSSEIEKIYHPLSFRERFSLFTQNKHNSKHIKLSFELVNSISKLLGIDKSSIGIEGSVLLGCFNPSSDIDLLVYGYKNAKKIVGRFPKLFKNERIKFYNKNEIHFLLQKRKNLGFGNNDKSILIQELRRLSGFIDKVKFSIISVLNEKDKVIIDLNREIKRIGTFEDYLFITDVKYSIVIPSVIFGKDLKGNLYKVELIIPYGFNQVKKKEKFFIKAPLYKNIFTEEKIIIVSFWNNIKQHFDIIIN